VDGIHDLGGLQGFGEVEVEPDEPVFHADWERRAFALTQAAGHRGYLTGRFRYAIERMDPVWYLSSQYYEHWLTGAATALVEAGIISVEELDQRLGTAFALARPDRAAELSEAGVSSDRHVFAVGDRVRVGDRHPFGHTRVPRYVRGKVGVVTRLDGVSSLPDVEYYGIVRQTEPTYSVRFEAIELWASPGDPVYVDLWQSYLESSQ
jgi:nitrile hydratase subunit beta